MKVIDSFVPRGRFADGTPFYDFHNPYGGSAPQLSEKSYDTVEAALTAGRDWCKDYERNTFPGGMASVLAILRESGGYKYVYSKYYSNS